MQTANGWTWTAVIAAALMLAACEREEDRQDDASATETDESPPLIERAVFFDDPEITGGTLSPDGEHVSFIQPLDGVMNVWVKGRGEDFEDAVPLTAESDRPVSSHWWSRDSEYVIYQQDDGGDENFSLYRVDPAVEPAEDEKVPEALGLTPQDNVQARVISRPWEHPDWILVGINDRDPRLHDVYRIQLEDGEKERIFENEANLAGYTADLDGELRLAHRQDEDGQQQILRIKDGELDEDPVYTCGIDESCNPMGFHPDGERAWMTTNTGERDLTELVLLDPASGDTESVHKDPEGEVDFGGAEFHPETRELLATYYVGDRLRVYFHDEDFEADYERVREGIDADGDIYFQSVTEDGRLQLVSVTSDTDPGATYVYDREDESVDLLYRPRPELPVEHLAEMEPVRYEARDGLEIPGYLTLPPGQAAEDLPLVVVPHGGPWARDTWGYDAQAQFLANRGYAVFQPNFRGSDGFGKEFLAAGNEEWGTGAMQHDITDGVEYLIDQGIADPDRVGIMGGSYGGYATLAGLAFTPDVYAAGVSIVGPSNIITLLESIPPYWGPIRHTFLERVGDPEDEEDRERLKEQSPLFSAEEIKAPLMVIQGANDPRVVQHESDQIVEAMRDLDRPVEYLVAEDEGHGFVGNINRLAMFADVERFLAEHLGGRYQEDMSEEIAERLEQLRMDPEEVDAEETEQETGAASG